MTLDQAITSLACATIAYALTRVLVRVRLAAPPAALMRVNVEDRLVPAVLGGPLALGSLGGMVFLVAVAAGGWEPARVGRVGVAVALLLVVMELAGSWDDRRGDESDRGFAGHVRALRSGRLTGGIVKVVAGLGSGAAAGAVVGDGWWIVVTALLVALAANALNLLDRAPGRAAKGFLVLALPLVVLGSSSWAVAASAVVGGLLACLPADLRQRAMLGDAGANPLGAIAGLGLAVSLPAAGRLVALALLLALNLASERWSFSRVIETSSWLAAVDRLGRGRPG